MPYKYGAGSRIRTDMHKAGRFKRPGSNQFPHTREFYCNLFNALALLYCIYYIVASDIINYCRSSLSYINFIMRLSIKPFIVSDETLVKLM